MLLRCCWRFADGLGDCLLPVEFLPSALDLFRTVRETTFQILQVMTDEDWKRAGWHPEHGLYTATLWLQIYAEHGHNHAAQIRRLRTALSH